MELKLIEERQLRKFTLQKYHSFMEEVSAIELNNLSKMGVKNTNFPYAPSLKIAFEQYGNLNQTTTLLGQEQYKKYKKTFYSFII